MKAFNAALLGLFLLVVAGFIGFQVYGQDILPNEDVKRCVENFKENLNRPTSFKRTLGTTEYEEYGLYKVTFEYTAKNGFGNTIPGRVEC